MIGGIVQGLTDYAGAIQLLTRQKFWQYMTVPILSGLFLGIAFIATAWTVSDDIGSWLIGFYPWEWGKSWMSAIAEVFGGIFVLAIGFILFKQLIMVISGPFMSNLSEQIERQERGLVKPGGFKIANFARETAAGLRMALRNITWELGLTLLFFLVGLFPPLTLPATVAIFLIQSFYAGFGSMDYTLERHLTYRQRITYLRQHRGYALGNGMIFMLLLLTGIGFLVALPLATAAAAKRLSKEKI